MKRIAVQVILIGSVILATLAAAAPNEARAGSDTDGNWNSRPTPAAVSVNWSS